MAKQTKSTASQELKQVGKHLDKALGAFGRMAKAAAAGAAKAASQATRAACEKTIAALDRVERRIDETEQAPAAEEKPRLPAPRTRTKRTTRGKG